ncbi:DUF4340 domain-containing protein [Cyanobacterium sp. uoEpiScrs1]|uniref:DUF4340 domain-containing protein n=1 Tax=Cyanobacterium sp. uoEpiScrs1 TaxID=2976343 RepID=UPI002269DF12|nr:DUF4340 domain-containing protein [Cyanobacterium sp. uoEpiScrs1]
MKLQKKTWGLLIAAVFLCTTVYIYEVKFQQHQLQIRSNNNKIFNFTEEDIKNISVKTKQHTLQFQQTEDGKKEWKMIHPKQATANDATISFLTNLLVTGESDRRFTISTSQQKDYGLNKPLATIKVILNDGSKHQIILGNSDFNDSFLYAKVDSNNQDAAEINISLVSKNYRYAIDREIDEWLKIDESLKNFKKTEVEQEK